MTHHAIPVVDTDDTDSISRPTDRETAGGLRLAAAAVYLIVVVAAFGMPGADPVFALILTATIPAIVVLLSLADLLERGGRVR